MSKIHVLNRQAVIDCPPSSTILDAALDAGLDFPFGCHSGACGACKTRLVSGEVDLLEYSELALSGEERAAGLILACRAVPRSDCVVTVAEENDGPRHPLRTLLGRVVATERATHDILIVQVAVPEGEEPLAFSAGQFANLTFPGAPSRDYSMANRPGEKHLVFHIRHVPNGVVSSLVHRADLVGQPVAVRGPYGMSYLRHDHAAPFLAVAGGSGLAPIASIVETALQLGLRQRIAVYFGARAERDLYLVDRFESLARQHPNLEYVPVLSNVGSNETTRRTGFLADAIRADHADLGGWKTYIAGPPPMVETVTAAVLALGVSPADCHTDPFFTTADRAAPEGTARRGA
jgi:CDP-4-dehydro-6-deoxyglucose reductase/ferredoxin-NAD(P)+ reductase (naphthalene dioxygenase ferredoxin-specific)